MALIKKNIWSLFYLIFISSFFLFIIISYTHWKEIKEDYVNKNEAMTRVVATYTKSYFEQLDLLLEVLGNRLIEDNNYKNKAKTKELFKKMLNINEAIIGYALINTKGDFLITSLDKSPKEIPNILNKDTFFKTLKTNKTTVGRTYMLPITKKLAIPVRKTFFNKDGKAIAVISIAIDAKNSNLFDKNFLNDNTKIINLIRAEDRYRQLYIYTSEDESSDNDIYNKPVTEKDYNHIMSELQKKYNKPIEQIKENESTVSFKFNNIVNNKTYVISSQYINNYKLWASSYILYDNIVNKFLKDFITFIFIYVSSILILWRLFIHIDNIEKRKRAELEYRANHDSLTNLPNRHFLLNETSQWIKDNPNFYLLFIDLDNFKTINDSFGHKIGDLVIKAISKRIEKTIDNKDILVRQSGDEFIVLTSKNSDISTYVKMILEKINEVFTIENKQFKISASIGVSNHPRNTKDINEITTTADMALYEAKKIRNAYVVFTEDIKSTIMENIQIEKELKTALENNEFHLVYQPQINYDNSIHGVEALIRWNNSNLGFIGPDKFIPIAETTGIMPKLGEFIIKRAFEEINDVYKNSSKIFQLSINISVKQFMKRDFYEMLMAKVKKYEMKPENITLEVTESVFIDNLEYLNSLLKKLRSEGFTISMDDFGTGYSSLSMLRKIPINELKIDKSFIDDITHDESARHMVKTIISIGTILKYDVVLAEGLEQKEQADLLYEYGCKTYQGYYYSKPLVKDELKKFMKKKEASL